MNTYSNVAKRNEYSDADLVMQHVDLVKRIAHHLAARLPSTVDVNDLMQSGMVGLLEAAGNFDASRGASFETYAGIRIRGAMLDDIRKHDWSPRSVHHKYRQVTDAISAIEAEMGRAATAEEIAERLGVSMDQYHKILADSAGSRLFSFEEALEEPTLQRKPPSSDAPSPDQELYQSQFRAQLSESIDELPERERLVLPLPAAETLEAEAHERIKAGVLVTDPQPTCRYRAEPAPGPVRHFEDTLDGGADSDTTALVDGVVDRRVPVGHPPPDDRGRDPPLADGDRGGRQLHPHPDPRDRRPATGPNARGPAVLPARSIALRPPARTPCDPGPGRPDQQAGMGHLRNPDSLRHPPGQITRGSMR